MQGDWSLIDDKLYLWNDRIAEKLMLTWKREKERNWEASGNNLEIRIILSSRH